MHRKNSLNAAGHEPGKKSHFGIARADAEPAVSNRRAKPPYCCYSHANNRLMVFCVAWDPGNCKIQLLSYEI
jgi:hypothetical protein